MIDRKVKKKLEKCLGKDKVFSDREYLISYSYDATGHESLPDVVVLPENETDIKNILDIAYENKIPVTPRGAGVGYSGGSVPLNAGIALVFTRMNKILTIDTENFIAEVEPGVVTYSFQKEVEKQGLFYPPDPASLKTSTIGGNVAENAGGMRCYKYGVTGNYVLGLEGFLINGEKIKTGSHVIKNVAGYDIKSLLIGSEGTLAVISKIILRLIPRPPCQRMFRVDFSHLREAAEFINQIIKANIGPSVLEFMDRSSLAAVYQYLELPLDDHINAAVLIEIDGNQTDVEERKKRFVQLVKDSAAIDYKASETEAEQEALWNIRRNISPAIAKLKPKKINEDIVVPVGKIPEAVDFINKLAEQYQVLIPMFGHIGDGNIHTNLMVDPDNKEEMDQVEIILDKILRKVIAMKGSISGEHGIGISKKAFMKYQFTDVEIELFRNVKKAFDPENLLNPGKIF